MIWLALLVLLRLIPVIGLLAVCAVSGPFSLGLAGFFLAISRKQDVRLAQVFSGFDRLWIGFGAYLLMGCFIFLWSLLLLIPGIVAAMSYSMTYFILAEDQSISAREALRQSQRMMYGHKWKYFCLLWRFFWWFLLCILTLWIGYLWLQPYLWTSFAKFYDEIKDQNQETNAKPVAATDFLSFDGQ